MLTRWRIPDWWPSEQQEILRRLQQSPTSPLTPLIANTQVFCLSRHMGPEEERFFAASSRFEVTKKPPYVYIQFHRATVLKGLRRYRSEPSNARPSLCITSQRSGTILWCMPDEPKDEQYDCIAVTWYELPP